MNRNEYMYQVNLAYRELRGEDIAKRIGELLADCEQEYGKDDALYAALWSELGAYHKGAREYEEAVRCFQQSRDILQNIEGTRAPNYGTVLNNLAGTYRLMQRFEEAEKYFREALAIYQSTLGEKHILYASALNNLSLVYLEQDRLEEAAQFQQKAVDVLRQNPDRKDETIVSLCNLGELHRRLRKFDEAEKYFTSALEMFETLPDKQTPHYHTVLNNLGSLYRDCGRMAESRAYFEKAAQAAESLYGPEHRETKAVQENLRQVLAQCAGGNCPSGAEQPAAN